MKTVLLKLILQLSLCIFLNKNKGKAQITKDNSPLTYPSTWIPSLIYYYIDDYINKGPIEDAIKRFQEESCLRFALMDNSNLKKDMEGIIFIHGLGCGTNHGKNSSNTLHKIFLNENCNKESDVGLIQKFIGKALGMPEQHRRPDRDNYISVNDTDVSNPFKYRLEKYNSSMVHLYGVGYDFNSLFHVDSTAFRPYNDTTPTFNGKPPEYNDMMGQTEGFSFADYKLLNYHYCNESYKKIHKSMPNCENSGYYDINKKKKGLCKCPNGFTGGLCLKLKAILKRCGETQEYNATSTNQTLGKSGKKNCTYRIKSKNGGKIKIILTNVTTQVPEPGKKCMPENGFEIKYRVDKSPAGLCLCGNYSNINLTSESNEVIVLFNGKNETDSFNLTYVEINKS